MVILQISFYSFYKIKRLSGSINLSISPGDSSDESIKGEP